MEGPMSVLQEAIEYYNRLLLARADEMPALFRSVEAVQLERNVSYENKPIPTLLRPHFIEPELVRLFERSVSILTGCLERVADAFIRLPEVRPRIPFPEGWEELLLLPSGLGRSVPVGRFDGFYSGGRLKYTEFNGDSPASVAWNEAQQQVFLELWPVKQLAEVYSVSEEYPMSAFFATVMGCYREFGLDEAPRMVIVDWDDVVTRPEFELKKEYFEERGIPTAIADPRELEFRAGALWAGDFRANLVSRRVILGELVERREECQGFIDGAASGKVCFVNPFRSKIAGNKASFAFLTDPKNRSLFSAEEQRAIAEHVPWTAVLGHEAVEYDGRSMTPFEVAAEFKDCMVVKPLNRYGGKGVVIGDEASDEEWSEVLTAAGAGGFCVQERIPIPSGAFPLTFPELHFEERKINLSPFSISGSYAGCLVRLSIRSIINVSSGGAQVPSFVLSGRR